MKKEIRLKYTSRRATKLTGPKEIHWVQSKLQYIAGANAETVSDIEEVARLFVRRRLQSVSTVKIQTDKIDDYGKEIFSDRIVCQKSQLFYWRKKMIEME